MPVELLFDSQCQLGEGPFWYADGCHWFDIEASQLHICRVDGSHVNTVKFSDHFSAAAELDTGGLLLASAQALWRYEPGNNHRISPAALTRLIDLETENSLTRSNDGRADRQGGFWIGTMGRKAEPGAGAIYRYYRGELRQLVDQVTIPNALCFSPDGTYAYYTDSVVGIIWRWPLDAEGWPSGEAEVFIDESHQNFHVDGAVIDSEGGLWSARWGAGQVVRYRADGSLDQVVELPVSQPSCPAFVGADLKTLLITTARQDLNAEQLKQQPSAGGLFQMPLAVAGFPEGIVTMVEVE